MQLRRGWQLEALGSACRPLQPCSQPRAARCRSLWRRPTVLQAQHPEAAAAVPAGEAQREAAATEAQLRAGRQPLLARGGSAADLVRALVANLEAGTDDERLTLVALRRACLRRHDPSFARSAADMDSLMLVLERLLRRNLAALTPSQLGRATR